MSYNLQTGRFFTVPMKKTLDVDIARNGYDLIKNSEISIEYLKDIQMVNAMRQKVVNKPIEKSATGLQVLYDYRKALSNAMQSVVQTFDVPFTWINSIERGLFLFSQVPQLSIKGGEFEKLCVLYNIAALMTQISTQSDLRSDEGLKTATKYFQESAGIFAYLATHTKTVLGAETPTTDLQSETLHAFECIMVAQSQECFYEKACSDPNLSTKPDLVAKIAMQASCLFSDAIKTLAAIDNAYALDTVTQQCKEKKDYYELKAQFHQAISCFQKSQFGEAIARYNLIDTLVNSLKPRHLVGLDINEFITSFNASKSKAENENNAIYHDIIPKLATLKEIGKAPIAQAKPYQDP